MKNQKILRPESNKNRECSCMECDCVPKQSFFKKNAGCLIASLISLMVIGSFLSLLVILIVFLVSFNTKISSRQNYLISGNGENIIAVINIDGIILEKEPARGLDSLTGEYTSSRKVKKILQEIENDDKVKAIILRINSPGGSAVASEEILQLISNIKKKYDLKVVSYFSDMAASGGYYSSLASDKIIANPSTITGSIGVIISYLNFAELADKYGVKNIVYKSGKFKDIGNEFKNPTEAENDIMQKVVEDAYEVFVSAVSINRNITTDKVRLIADGRIYSGKQAKDLGLVDALGNFEDAVSEAKKLAGLENASVLEFGQPTFWEVFMGSVLSKFNLSLIPNIGSYFDFKPGLKVLYLYNP